MSTPNHMNLDTYKTFFATLPERSARFLRMYGMYVLLGILALVVLLIIFLAVSLRALPGDSLYGVKTRVVEPTIRIFYLTPKMQADHSIGVLERRLRELESISKDQATTTSETLGNFAWLVQSEVRRANDALASTGSLSGKDALNIHLGILSAADAHQTLARASEEFASIEDTIGEARGDAYRAFETKARDFASTTPDEAGSYLSEQLTALEGELSTVAQGSTAQNRALDRLEDAQDAIMANELGDAIVFILRARQAIAVDQYLFDSERGPQSGDAPIPAPTTEGQ